MEKIFLSSLTISDYRFLIIDFSQIGILANSASARSSQGKSARLAKATPSVNRILSY